MGRGPIPFSALDRYADRYGIADIDEFEQFRVVIRAMDGAFLEKTANDEPGTVAANDVSGMKSLLAGIATRLQAPPQETP